MQALLQMLQIVVFVLPGRARATQKRKPAAFPGGFVKMTKHHSNEVADVTQNVACVAASERTSARCEAERGRLKYMAFAKVRSIPSRQK